MIGDGLGRSHPPLLASLNFEDEMLHECLSLVAVAPFRKSLGIYFVRSTAQLHPSLLDRPIPSQATASVIRTVRSDVNFPIESGARAPGCTGNGPLFRGPPTPVHRYSSHVPCAADPVSRARDHGQSIS